MEGVNRKEDPRSMARNVTIMMVSFAARYSTQIVTRMSYPETRPKFVP